MNQLSGMNAYDQAIRAMYGQGNQEERQAADKWLQHFCTTTEAWQTANAVIGNPQTDVTSPHMAFACKMLLDKISMDLHELPEGARVDLRGAVCSHVMMWGAAPGTSGPILKKLCLSLASLGVQMNWTGYFDYCKELSLKAQSGQEAVVTRVVLQLLAALPDACDDRQLRLHDREREAFQEVLQSYIPQVMTFMQQTWSNPLLRANEGTMVSLLECFSDWVQFCRIDPGLLAQHPLLPAALEQLENPTSMITPTLFEKTVDLTIEVLRKYDARPEHMVLVQLIVPRVMAMRTRYEQAVAQDDEDQTRGLCRIFTEMAESYIDLLLSKDDTGQKALIQIVLLCTSSDDTDNVGITLRFWYAFFQGWHKKRIYNKESNSHEDDTDLKEAIKVKYSEEISILALQCVRHMTYPADLDQLDQEEREKLGSWRREVSDALEDCCLFLGPKGIISMIWQKVATEEVPKFQTTRDWQGLEACLYALLSTMGSLADRQFRNDDDLIRGLRKDVRNMDDGTAMSILQLGLGFQGAEPMWSSCGTLRATLSLVLGALAPWFLHKNATEQLQSAFNFLYANLTHDQKSVSGAAAHAMCALCGECGTLLGEPVLALYEQLRTFPRGHLNEKDELAIVDGLAAVANKLPYDGVCRAVERLVGPLRDCLSSSIAALQAGTDIKGTTAEIRRCVEIFLKIVQNLSVPPEGNSPHHPAVVALQMVWPFFDQLLLYFRKTPEMLELICKGYKYSMRCAKRHFAPCLDNMINHLLTHFAGEADPAFLYAGSICVTEFGRDFVSRGENLTYGSVLLNMVQRFSEIVFNRLVTLDAFSDQSEMVEEYFFLVSRFLEYCPSQLLPSSLLGSIIQCGSVGLQVDSRRVHKGVMTCFYHIFNCGLIRGCTEQQKVAVMQVMTAQGQTIVRAIMNGLAGDKPLYGLDLRRANPATVLWLIAKLSPEGLHALLIDALNHVPLEICPEVDRQNWMATLAQCIAQQRDSGVNAENLFYRAIEDFHGKCKNNARVLRRRRQQAEDRK